MRENESRQAAEESPGTRAVIHLTDKSERDYRVRTLIALIVTNLIVVVVAILVFSFVL